MRGKKLVLLLVMLCMLLTEGGVLTYAAEASADATTEASEEMSTEDAVETAQTTQAASVATETTRATEETAEATETAEVVKKTAEENTADAETKETVQQTEEESNLAVEVSNVTNTLMNALSQSITATITLEREKLPKYSEEDLMYLACIIYCESGDQDFEGMVAVANVVMNRAKSEEFDHVTTIKEVIYDCERWGRQFSPAYKRDSNGKWTTKGSFLEKTLTMYKTGVYPKDWQEPQMERCIEAAKAALEGKVVLKEEYLYFNMAISSTKEKCKKQGRTYQVIGYHIFH